MRAASTSSNIGIKISASSLKEKRRNIELIKKHVPKMSFEKKTVLKPEPRKKFVSQKKIISTLERQKQQQPYTDKKEGQIFKNEPKKIQITKIEPNKGKFAKKEVEKKLMSRPTSGPGGAEPRKEKTINSEENKQDAKPEKRIPKVEQVSSTAPAMDPTPDGHYELNARMTRMLDAELQHIMIKIWQDLPDDPPTKAEKLVADKFRNKAGDELRNVLGLNVTKRLLNIHNPLYVKIHFSGKPEPGRLKIFLKNYNICAFKRLDKPPNTFAAQLKTFNDFDNICTAKDLRCGSAKLKITPCYKFIKCPDKLRTPYVDDELEEEEDKNKSTEGSEPATENKNDKDKKSPTKYAKTLKTEHIIAEKSNIEPTTKNDSKIIETKIQNKLETKSKKEDYKISKPNVTSENKAAKTNIKPVTKTQNVKKISNDEEEMTDEDIFALLSGKGIVLDECSGSDDE